MLIKSEYVTISYNEFKNCHKTSLVGGGLAYKIVTSRNEKATINNLKSGGDAYDNFDLSMWDTQL